MNALAGSGVPPNKTPTIYFPGGYTYILDGDLDVPTGFRLIGDGYSTIIKQKAGSAITDAAFRLGHSGGYAYGTVIKGFQFQLLTGTWAIKPSTATLNVTACEFRDLLLASATSNGLSLTTYTQVCVVDKVLSTSPLEQMLVIRGNFNMISNLDKEGTAGTSTAAYVEVQAHVAGSTGNIFKNILLEGVGNVNKPLMLIGTSYQTTIENFWAEATTTNGFAIEIDSSRSVRMTGITHLGYGSIDRIKLTTSSDLSIERLDLSGGTNSDTPADVFSIDATSAVRIGTLHSQGGGLVRPIAANPNNAHRSGKAGTKCSLPASMA